MNKREKRIELITMSDVYIPDSPSESVVLAPQRPRNYREVEAIFGKIVYHDVDGGSIGITNDFVKSNIRHEFFTISKEEIITRKVHRLLCPVYDYLFEELSRRDLIKEIIQFSTFAPRHIMRDSKKPLSLHSWGIACDINQDTNRRGTKGDMHPEIIECFEAVGFWWGGRFKTPDPMHFEYFDRSE